MKLRRFKTKVPRTEIALLDDVKKWNTRWTTGSG